MALSTGGSGGSSSAESTLSIPQLIAKMRDRQELTDREITILEQAIHSRTMQDVQIGGTQRNDLVVFGLYNGTLLRDVVQISLDRQNIVQTVSQTPSYVEYGSAACAINNILYAVGLGRAPYIELWNYRRGEDWQRLQDVPSGRIWHCVTTVDAVIYVLGGWGASDSRVLDEVVSYNTLTDEWTTAGRLTHAVRGAACVTYNNSIYVFGGQDKDNNAVPYVQMYSTTGQSCTVLSESMPRVDYYYWLSAVLWQTSAILLHYVTCLIYNFETGTWQVREQFKTDVGRFGLVLSNGTIYVAGGHGKSTHRDEIKKIRVMDIVENKPAVWKHHATLSQRAEVYCYAVLH